MTAVPALTIGDIAVARVEELRLPDGISRFTRDAALVDAHRHWLAPDYLAPGDMFDLVFQSFVFECNGRMVLVDPCTGNGMPHPVPVFADLDVPYIERLEASGFRAQDIDFVVCTHLHHDHCGWNTCLRDGKWVPTFPNARYVLQQAEVARWGSDAPRHKPFALNDGVFARSIAPVLDAGLADVVCGRHALAPGLAVELTGGHTVGHQLLHVASAGRQALFTGDCFHHPLQLVEPSLPFGDAEDVPTSERVRHELVERAADTGALLIAAHLPAPHGVKVSRQGDEFVFAASSVA